MGSQFSVRTAVLDGVSAVPVTVEVDIGPGLPGMCIVGLPDLAVSESRLRIKSALRASGYSLPDANIVVNLAPARLKKTGTGFDLPIAIAILGATRQIDTAFTADSLICGELSLDGRVREVQGLLAHGIAARADGLALVSAPASSLCDIEGLECRGVKDLASLRVRDTWALPHRALPASAPPVDDYSDIVGQDQAKRALQIAAAGNHGILLEGAPGSGKTMLAKRLPGILPPLDTEEIYRTALVHSVAGLPTHDIFAGKRPFRHPHHSATAAGLIGGGSTITPGEVSLAHNGVLFLDEMAEFAPSVLQALRQPLEDGEVTIVRASSTVTYPAHFMLVGATNPCPCGYLGDPEKPCLCTEAQVSKYRNKIGGPLMDRIDMVVDVWRTDPMNVLETGSGVGSARLAAEVIEARAFAAERRAKGKPPTSFGIHKEHELLDECALSTKDRNTFETLARGCHLSGRGIMRTLRVARTIADLASCASVGEEHMLEALAFRVRGEFDG